MGVVVSTGTGPQPRTFYAAVKWAVGADKAEISRTLPNDLEILALTLMEEHGFTYGEIEEMFENAVSAVEWCL